MIKITPTLDKGGFWISYSDASGSSVFDSNIQFGLERCSDTIASQIKSFQEKVKELQSLKKEVDKELKSRGGKLRPRRVHMPKSDVWFSDCINCYASNDNLNMVAIETSVDVVVTYCRKCGKKKFPHLVE